MTDKQGPLFQITLDDGKYGYTPVDDMTPGEAAELAVFLVYATQPWNNKPITEIWDRLTGIHRHFTKREDNDASQN